MSNHEVFKLPNFRLQAGVSLPEAQLAYKTYGTLNATKTNVILYPTSYAAHHSDIDWLIGPDKILDPTRYFIVITNMFGNGLSTSPSNLGDSVNNGSSLETVSELTRSVSEGDQTPDLPSPSLTLRVGQPVLKQLPVITHIDNVTAQRRLLREVFGIERLALAYGWSMGAQQALHWGALFPNEVERIAAVCSSAKTTPHNIVFLEGLRAALITDPAWNGERFTDRPERGLRAFGRIYAGWAMSQAFYRERKYLELGYSSLEDFLIRDWEASFLRRDAANLLSMIETWKRSDISDNDIFRGDLKAALGAIRARTLIMPSETDLYFTPEDAFAESQQMPNARYLPIPSIWGHRAGNPAKNPEDQLFLKNAIAELLSA